MHVYVTRQFLPVLYRATQFRVKVTACLEKRKDERKIEPPIRERKRFKRQKLFNILFDEFIVKLCNIWPKDR